MSFFSWLIVPHIFQKSWALLPHLSIILLCTVPAAEKSLMMKKGLKGQSLCDYIKDWNSTLHRQHEQYKMVCLKHHNCTYCID